MTNKKREKMVRQVFTLTPMILELLRDESVRTGLSMSEIVRRAIEEYVGEK
jgi:hypothetical protein